MKVILPSGGLRILIG
jgi:hypothetical protein